MGERLRLRRERLRMTRPVLASRIGMSKRQVARYERDEIAPPADVMGMLALVLETTTDYLIGLSDDPYVPDPDSPTRAWSNAA